MYKCCRNVQDTCTGAEMSRGNVLGPKCLYTWLNIKICIDIAVDIHHSRM